MKKAYIKPQMEQELLVMESMICDSITAKSNSITGDEPGFEKGAKGRRYADEDDDFAVADIW